MHAPIKMPRAIPMREMWGLKIQKGFGFRPLPRLFEDPWRREILDDLYRFRRGEWDIAKVPDLDGPPEFEVPDG